MAEIQRPRFKVRIGTILLAIVIVALLLMVAMQQRQLGRQQSQLQLLRNQLDAERLRVAKTTTIAIELRDMVERQRQPKPSSSQP